MIIEKLELKNFRGIEGLELDFDEKVNVIFGVNGAGKSSVLDSIAIMLSWAVNRIKYTSSSGKPISENDIKNNTYFSAIELQADFATWKVAKNKKGHRNNSEKSDYNGLKGFIQSIQSELTLNHENTNIPLFVYYPIGRSVTETSLKVKSGNHFDILSAYTDALGGSSNFKSFFEWYRVREDLENERYITYEDNLARIYDKQLQTIREAWEIFLPEFRNFRVKRSPLRLEVEKNGTKISVNQLSDGEKILITTIGDLARRLSMANPTLDNPLEGQAIVLIDEIDLHLHPKWQRMVINKLPQVFPNCQFIVTTHSPHVITHTKPENLIRLTQVDMKIDWERPIESYGKSVDRVLEDLMGLETTRPDSVSDEISTIYTLIDKAQLDSAKSKILELKQLIGEDPDLVKAEVLIRRKEIIGK